MNRRDLLAALSALACGGTAMGASAATPRYGVLSAIGRELGVVTYRSLTDSRIDPNERSTVTLGDDLFDMEALRVLQAGLQRAAPDAGSAMLYLNHDAELARHPEPLFEKDTVQLPPALLDPMRADGVERLLLLTRHRREADLHAAHSDVGAGKLDGLGYYVDYRKRMRRSDTGEVGRGYIAPYVYLRLSLVDMASLAVLGEQMINGSTTLSAARSQSDNADPWSVLTAQQKADLLMRIMDRQLREALPRLIMAG